jgi:hypothetical protein
VDETYQRLIPSRVLRRQQKRAGIETFVDPRKKPGLLTEEQTQIDRISAFHALREHFQRRADLYVGNNFASLPV